MIPRPDYRTNNDSVQFLRGIAAYFVPVLVNLVWLCLPFETTTAVAGGGSAPKQVLSDEYTLVIRPLVTRYCLSCHSTATQQGELDLERFGTFVDVIRETKVWWKFAEMLGSGEMPPDDSKQPTADERKQLRDWVQRYLEAEALANAGDPGRVDLRRLNNAEYRHTIRDLTDVDLDPAREFPTDNAAGEGFTNAGNALSMSPALLQKYLDAGKEIARHAVSLPDGFRFSPHVTPRDWTDQALARIRETYRQFVDPEDIGSGTIIGNLHSESRLGTAGRLPVEKYLAATITEREALLTGRRSVDAVARDYRLNATYLKRLWSSLTDAESSLLLDQLRGPWLEARAEDAALLAADVALWQKGLWAFNPVGLIGRKGSRSRWMEPVDPITVSQEFRITLPAPAAEEKEVLLSLVATDAGDGNEHDYVVWKQPRLVAKDQPEILLRDVKELTGMESSLFGRHPDGSEIDAGSICVHAPCVMTLHLPADVAAGREFVVLAELHTASETEGSVQPEVVLGTPTVAAGIVPSQVTVTLSKVTALYPEHRTVSFRYPVLVGQNSNARQRFELAMNAHRNLFPAALFYAQIIPLDEALTLTLFYREDDHLLRLMLDEAQKTQLDRLWEELRYISQEALKTADVLDSLVETTKRHPQEGAFDLLIEPFHKRAARFRTKILESQPAHVEAIVDFAAKAYRRPLEDDEATALRQLYRQLRDQNLDHEDAFRLTLARIFIAAPFLYRIEVAPEGVAAAPVSDWELASRISYFLWSSQPDEELRRAASLGILSQPNVLAQQTQRMLKDNRIRRLATEFACQWLQIHDFDVTESKSEQLFPEFTNLRSDMYQESILFLTDIFQSDAALLSLLNADHTFVNSRLATFYGVKNIDGDAWQRVEGMRELGRGGILGLATTLAKQSGVSRTSPILRGNWVSEVLLGEKLPRPPKNVPPLADAVPEGLTERQLIERHRSDVACAKCHQRIDPLGFALEGFDAIGRRRDQDSSGAAIDTRSTLPDGEQIAGLDGLRNYLLQQRRTSIVRQFCRKLVGYALGRETQLSDQALLQDLERLLAENSQRVSAAIKTIISSPQFCNIRGSSQSP